jgi:cytochrome bd-type quinol oxidase subunit 2
MAGHVVAAPTGHREASLAERIVGSRYAPVGLAVVFIWAAVLVASIWAPVMITGSNHERLAVAAMGDWFWGGLATGLLLLAAAFARVERTDVWRVVATISAVIWIAVALASVFAPSMVTGTDPTTIPLVAMLAPIAGAIVTAFLAVFAAGMGARSAD